MNFQLPDDNQLVEFFEINSLQELRQILAACKQEYEKNGIQFYYEIRHWVNSLSQSIQKIGAYCKFCKAKLVYSKQKGSHKFNLQECVSQHQNHPKTEPPGLLTNYYSKKIRNQQKKIQKSADVISQKLVHDLYKEFIIQWLIEYEKNLRKLMKKNQNFDQQIKYIEQPLIINSINISSSVINEEQKKLIFQKPSLWNQLVQQILSNQCFRKVGFTQKSAQNSFVDILFVKQQFILEQQRSQHIFIIRRQLGTYVNHLQTQKCQPFDCIIAYQLNSDFQPDLLWFALAQKQESFQSQQPLNILQVLVELESRRSFANCRIIIENDQKLMVAFTLLKQIILQQNQVYDFCVCIHPFIVDNMIQNQINLNKKKKQTIKQSLRCLNLNQAETKINQVFSQSPRNLLLQKIIKYKNYTWLSCMDSERIGIQFLPQLFYQQNSIQNSFMQIREKFKFKGPITLNVLPMVILIIFQNFCVNFSNSSIQINQKPQVQHYFPLATSSSLYQKSFSDIFKKSIYRFQTIKTQCPRIIIQLIYNLIPKAFRLLVQKTDFIQVQVKKFVKLKQIDANKQMKVLFDVQEFKNSQDQKKLWYCECRFYKLYGVPCQHEILCALNYQTSLYREISQDWRNIEQIRNKKKQLMITQCLTKLLF